GLQRRLTETALVVVFQGIFVGVEPGFHHLHHPRRWNPLEAAASRVSRRAQSTSPDSKGLRCLGARCSRPPDAFATRYRNPSRESRLWRRSVSFICHRPLFPPSP